MRIAIVSFLFFFLSFEAFSQQNTERGNALGVIFIEAVKSKEIEKYIAIKPSAAMWKVVSPQETSGLSDDEIYKSLIMSANLKFSFDNISASMIEHSIVADSLSFFGSYLEMLGDTPVALSIDFMYEGKKGTFWVSVVSYNNRLYLAEIKNSYRIFDHLGE